MKTEALLKSASLEWTLFAFFLFMIVFIGILIKTYSIRNKKYYEQMGELPLRDQEGEAPV